MRVPADNSNGFRLIRRSFAGRRGFVPDDVLVECHWRNRMSRSRPFVTLDAWETLLVLVLLAIAASLAAVRLATVISPPKAVQVAPHQSSRERAVFETTYGPDHFSEREEEWMIRDYFRDRRDGVFVDVGANHFKNSSKTYYLESMLGWSGLAIEPQREFAADYAAFRPRTKFLPFFVSDVSNDTAKLYITKRSSKVASSDKAFVEQFGKADEVRDVPTITLTDLLVSEGIAHVDFLSMDIELHEPHALKGFDIERFQPSLVCVEGLLPVRQQIIDYFTQRGYALVGKYMWVDLENLYFSPLPRSVTKN
jgi:FkbM family methyltransferase